MRYELKVVLSETVAETGRSEQVRQDGGPEVMRAPVDRDAGALRHAGVVFFDVETLECDDMSIVGE